VVAPRPIVSADHESGADRRGSVFLDKGKVGKYQRLLLIIGESGIPQDVHHQVAFDIALIEDSGPHVERLGRDAKGLGDLLEELRYGFEMPARAERRRRDSRAPARCSRMY
jgi:hypothetical protein